MITQEMIEDSVVKYIQETQLKPKYVLMDKKSYYAFNKSFEPIEKNNTLQQNQSNIKTFHPTQGCQLDILSIDVDKELFEIVG